MSSPRRYGGNEPFFLQWHITSRCNLSCSHCYREDGGEDLPIDTLCDILDGYARLLKAIGRPGRIQFTGGEPFLSPHLFSLIERAATHMIPSRILSNGTCITAEMVKQLVRSRCRTVQVSIEGREKTHDAVRGNGAFGLACAGIGLLRQADIKVTINTTVARETMADLAAVIDLAAECADRFCIGRLVPTGRAQATSMLTAAELKQCFDIVADGKKRHGRLDIPYRDPLWHEYLDACPHRGGSVVQGCSAGYNCLAVEADGTVYPCRRLPMAIGNAVETPLDRLWRDAPLLAELRDRDGLKGKCRGCPRRWMCGGCRGVAWATTGDHMAEDPQCFG